MRLLNGKSYEGNVPTFVDLNSHIAINGQIYTRDLTPVPFAFMDDLALSSWRGTANPDVGTASSLMKNTISAKKNIPYSNYQNLTIYTNSHITYGGSYRHEGVKCQALSIIDNVDDSIVYSMPSVLKRDITILKTKTDKDTGHQTRSQVSLIDGANHEIIGQCTNFVYVAASIMKVRARLSSSSFNGLYNRGLKLYVVRKSDMSLLKTVELEETARLVDAYSVFEIKPIHEDDECIYLYYGQYTNGNAESLYKIEKSSQNAILVYKETGSPLSSMANTSHGMPASASEMIVDGDLRIFYSSSAPEGLADGIYQNNIFKVTVNNKTLECTVETLPNIISCSGTANRHNIFRCETTRVNGSVYVSFIPCCRTYDITDGDLFKNYTDPEIITYRVEDDYSLTETGRVEFSTESYYVDALSRHMGSQLIMPAEKYVDFWVFNLADEVFELKNTIAVDFLHAFLDFQDRLWIKDRHDNLAMYNEQLSTDIKVHFKEKGYAYTGTSVSSSIEFSATNFNGEYIVASLDVTLHGNCTFFDGEKKKRLSTSNIGVVEEDVVINGAGGIRVSAQLVR